MSNFFNSPILTLLQSGPKTPEQQVQYATSPLQQSLNGEQRVSLPDFTAQPIQIKPIIPARDATGTAQSVRYNTHTDQVPTNVDERLKQNRQILGGIVETAIDFTPVIGDIKGLTWDPIKAGIEGGFGAGLSMAGLGLIGLIPGVGDWIKKSKIKKLDDKIFNYETLNPKIVNISQNVKPSYKKWNTLNFEEELEKLNIVKQDKEDAIKLINFAKTFGYKLPKGIENYTGDLLDKEYKRILKQHNTFVRGIDGNDYHFTTIPKYGNKVGAQQGMPEYAFGKYTTNALNNTSPYEKIGIVRRKLDFTGPRKDWIIKNHPLQYNKSVIPKINELFSYKLPDTWYKMDDKQLNLLYSTALKNFYLEHPNLSNKNKISFGGSIIHHGLPGEQVLDLINIYHPKKTNIDKDITKGFSKIRPKYNNSLRQWEDFTF